MSRSLTRSRRLAFAVALVAALGSPALPAASAKGTPAQCDAVGVLTQTNPDPAMSGAKQAKAELARMRAAAKKLPAALKSDADRLLAYWAKLEKWGAKYPDPAKAQRNKKAVAEYTKLSAAAAKEVGPAMSVLMDWSSDECSPL